MPATREESQDIWSDWLLYRRHARDSDCRDQGMEYLRPIRDRVLEHASLTEGDKIVDVGCGDGLIAFGALEKINTGTAVFVDISQAMLDHCKGIAEKLGLLHRCRFLNASAEDLSEMENESATVVTTRSVLIYVANKPAALEEFHRILRPEGRFSIFEPINRFGYPRPDHVFGSYDVTPVMELSRKVMDIYRKARPSDSDPMIDFDERDLFTLAEEAGFSEVHMGLEAHLEPPRHKVSWDAYYGHAPNPMAPTVEEAVTEALTASERDAFIAHLRPLVESGQGKGKAAVAYLWGVK